MRVFQNKIFVGGICIFVAAILAFLLLPAMNKKKGDTIMTYKLNSTISAGTQITEEMLAETEVGAYGLPESVVKDKGQLVGKFANCSITPEELILTAKLSDFAADKKLDAVFANGQKLVCITVSSVAAGVGNHIQAGDIISVYSYADDKVIAYAELKNLEVYSVENDDAQSLEEAKNDEDAEKLAATVTLIVNDVQAEKLVLSEYSGKLHIVFERRGNA